MSGGGVPGLGVAVGDHDQVGLGEGGVGEGCDPGLVTVGFTQFVDGSSVECSGGAGVDAGGVLAGVAVVVAEVAFGHVSG